MLRQSLLRIVLVLSLATVGFANAGCEASCEEACDLWASCSTWGASCWKPTYDTCMKTCKADGDWDYWYLTCIQKVAGACCAMADC